MKYAFSGVAPTTLLKIPALTLIIAAASLGLFDSVRYDQGNVRRPAESVHSAYQSSDGHLIEYDHAVEHAPVAPPTRDISYSTQSAETPGPAYKAPEVAAEAFDIANYEKNHARIKYDSFGNYLVDLTLEGGKFRQFLLSNWPLHYPTPSERDSSTVEGCMSLNYYVRLQASTTLLIVDGKHMRTYHSQCEFDNLRQQYHLVRREQPHSNLKRSIKHLLVRINRQNELSPGELIN